MYTTIITIKSVQKIPEDIDIITLAHAIDNGDEIGLTDMHCFWEERGKERMPWEAPEDEEDEISMHGWHNE
jgi:hypothetical protein